MSASAELLPAPSYFVGIDPSLTGTGVCVLNEKGGVETLKTISTTNKSHGNRFDRIEHITTSILHAIDMPGKSVICIEQPFVDPKNMNSQQDLIALGFMIRRCLYREKIPYRDVAPRMLKKFVCDKGNAKKDMMMMEVLDRWKIKPQDDNQADAVGLAHISMAVDAIRNGGELNKWAAYQLEAARKAMTGE